MRHLNRSSNHVVVRVLFRERVAAGLTVCSQQPALRVLSSEHISRDASPQPPSRPQLSHLHVEVHADAKEEREPRSHCVYMETWVEVRQDIGTSEMVDLTWN